MDLKSAQLDTYYEWLQDRGLSSPVVRERARPELAVASAEAAAPQEPEPVQELFGWGSETPRVVFIGDGPLGPEVAAERELLEKIATAMKLAPEDYFVTTALRSEMPATELPPPEAFAPCQHDLKALLRTLQPQGIVVMGMVATRAVFGERAGFHELRGELHDSPLLADAAWLVTYHPRDLLRHPAAKREAWTDLQKLMGRLG